ncbi:multiubiquitin domain-containing protein [Flagellimonas amoyensis]|uniref:multiubiquitin domain-containing protein n=1 Tax=Flagellimonas amoyensis TaxID=2169401 RepID=UPI00131F049D|nr:multiubiquitin domain-containing protein [Allomuricauda amoyensis]
MAKFIFKLNNSTFETENSIIKGSEILSLAGLGPVEDYELLQKINEKGFEPIQLEEEVDLREVGIEGFRAKPYRKIPIIVDGETYEVEECFMTPLEIMALVNRDEREFFLKEIRNGDVEVGYREDLEHKVGLSRKSVFQTCPLSIEYHLIVNAKEKVWNKPFISYEEVIKLAYGSISTDPNVCYTVIYKRGPKGFEEGSLVKGQKVKVKQRMIFNVTATNKS